MNIKINIPTLWLKYTNNQRVVEVNGGTVGKCLNHLVKQFPGLKQEVFDDNGTLQSYVDIYVNEKNAYPELLAKPVGDGDVLDIVFAFHGG